MQQAIIYNGVDGVPLVIFPSPEILKHLTIEQVALKDVPAGVRFKIIDTSELPEHEPQDRWLIDEADLDDGVGATYGEGTPLQVIGYGDENQVLVRNINTGEESWV